MRLTLGIGKENARRNQTFFSLPYLINNIKENNPNCIQKNLFVFP